MSAGSQLEVPGTDLGGESPAEHAHTMTHREVLVAMSGLLLAMFVTILSSTIVSTALPRIVHDLGGGQASYTWVVTSTLLALTVTTPIWGKLADSYDRKLLVQIGLSVYVIGSMLAGMANSMAWLIACRVFQGLGVGGLTALVQVILADLVSPRERGRYAGYLGAVFGAGTVAGPLLGGLITDTLGWRWCFYVTVPIAVLALIVLQLHLHLPHRPGRVRSSIDWRGALLLGTGTSLLMIWVTRAGQSFAWLSLTTLLMVGGGVLVLVVAVWTERRVPDPLIPLRLFANRTVVLAVIASLAVGTALFGATVYLSQYMQIARGYSPTASGLLTIPMVVAMALASALGGRRIVQTGRYRRLMISGALLMTAGMALMGFAHERTSLVELGVFMALVGTGVGLMMQNIVVVVQNSLAQRDMGSGSALVTFFRTLGGAAGVSLMGALLAERALSGITSGLAAAGVHAPASTGQTIPRISDLPEPVARIVEHAYAAGIADIFLAAAPLGVVALIAILMLHEHPLGTRSGIEIDRSEAAAQV